MLHIFTSELLITISRIQQQKETKLISITTIEEHQEIKQNTIFIRENYAGKNKQAEVKYFGAKREGQEFIKMGQTHLQLKHKKLIKKERKNRVYTTKRKKELITHSCESTLN